MTPCLHIIRPGLLTTIQDIGRLWYQAFGMAVSGALDSIGLRAANALVGNAPGTGALEVLYVGPTIAVEADDVRMSFAGANAAIEILPDLTATHGRRVESMRSIRLRRREIVRIGSLSEGAVLYLAVEGGFDIEPTLGSVSTDIRGGIGGWQARPLTTGDRLPLRLMRATERDECRIEGLDLRPPSSVRAIAGPQSDYFAESEIAAFFASEYTVGAGSNRQGMRLEGRRIAHVNGYNITSDAIAPGSIQVPGNGQPIALLADRQTTGGYPKIATVISADVPALGRLPIGAKIRFERVTIERAQELRRIMANETELIGDKIVPITRSSADSDVVPKLSAHNLISGVVNAGDWVI
jgi:biotin-dependent carboxylase-like uncharacterized protein